MVYRAHALRRGLQVFIGYLAVNKCYLEIYFIRAEKQFDIEMWDDRREFYHAWFDDEWGSPSWLMSDIFYGQV